MAALAAAAGAATAELPALVDALAARAPALLLLLDSVELLTPLEGWLAVTLLPALPEGVVTVIAGRAPPSAAWRTDPAWADLLRVVGLRNLQPEEVRAFLSNAGIAPEVADRVEVATHGHPLAMALAADLLSRPDAPAVAELAEAPELVSALLARFVDATPPPLQRRALAVCARQRRGGVRGLLPWCRGAGVRR